MQRGHLNKATNKGTLKGGHKQGVNGKYIQSLRCSGLNDTMTKTGQEIGEDS